MVFLVAGLAVAAALQNSPTTAQTGRLSGVVIEEGTNLPVAGAKVEYAPADQPPSPLDRTPETTTDEEGRFAFETVTPGRYRIVAHKEDFAPPLEESAFPVIELAADQDVNNVSIALSHGGAIAGRVLAADGSPVDGANLMALLKGLDTLAGGDAPVPNGKPFLMPLGQGNTGGRGEFTIERLPPGDYLIAASARSGTTYYPNTTDESVAETVSVRTGHTVSDITIRMVAVPTFRVSGIVTDADGTPVPDVPVNLMPDLRRETLLALFAGGRGAIVTGADGAFVFENIPRGSYIASASDDGGLAVAVGGFEATVAIDRSGAVTAETNGKKLPLSPGSIAVSVTDADVTGLKITRTGKNQ